MRKGFTLTECMLASSIICLTALVSLEGVIVTTRIAHENSEILAADAIAWDAAWKRFNEDFTKLKVGESSTETLSDDAAGPLNAYDTPAQLIVSVTDDDNFPGLRKVITDVEWGPSNKRRRLSTTKETSVCRSDMMRISWE